MNTHSSGSWFHSNTANNHICSQFSNRCMILFRIDRDQRSIRQQLKLEKCIIHFKFSTCPMMNPNAHDFLDYDSKYQYKVNWSIQRSNPKSVYFDPWPICPERLQFSYMSPRITFRWIFEGYYGEGFSVPGRTSTNLYHEMLKIVDSWILFKRWNFQDFFSPAVWSQNNKNAIKSGSNMWK